jgi:hypothetical protein
MAGAGEPAHHEAGVPFTYDGTEVAFDAGRLVDVTGMWRAAGSPPSKKFAEWCRQTVAVSFIKDLAKELKVGVAHLIYMVSLSGQGKSGTWVHGQVALASARCLSHDFHRCANEAFREWAEEQADLGLKAERAVEAHHAWRQSAAWVLTRLGGSSATAPPTPGSITGPTARATLAHRRPRRGGPGGRAKRRRPTGPIRPAPAATRTPRDVGGGQEVRALRPRHGLRRPDPRRRPASVRPSAGRPRFRPQARVGRQVHGWGRPATPETVPAALTAVTPART